MPGGDPGQSYSDCSSSCIATYRAACESAYQTWLASDHGTAATAAYVSALVAAKEALDACLANCPES